MTKHRNDRLALFIGFGLVVLGLWLLVERFAGPLMTPIREGLAVIRSVGWPLAVIALGVLLIIGVPKLRAGDLKGKRLYRARKGKMVAGVLGGVADYIGADPTWVRLAYVVFALAVGFWPALGLYIIGAIVVPEEPANPAEIVVENPEVSSAPPKPPAAPPVPPIPDPPSSKDGA